MMLIRAKENKGDWNPPRGNPYNPPLVNSTLYSLFLSTDHAVTNAYSSGLIGFSILSFPLFDKRNKEYKNHQQKDVGEEKMCS